MGISKPTHNNLTRDEEFELKTKALEVIELIVGEDERITKKQSMAIYRFSHVALNRCNNPHLDWLEELRTQHSALKKENML